MKYPGRIIKVGETDGEIVIAVRRRLNEALGDASLRLDPDNRSFDAEVRQTVKLFQARNVDNEGRPLKQDGVIGSLTWVALFGEQTIPSPGPADDFSAAVLWIAAEEVAKQVREEPKNSNRGPRVEQYLGRVGVPAGRAWCCAFVYWCFDEAADQTRRSNPMVKTGGCLDHWNQAATREEARRVRAADAVQDPSLLQPGMIFIMDHGEGRGHTGLIERISGGLLTTIEGNTDASKTREGGGVYRLMRKVSEINKGYIAYTVP